MSAVLDGAKVGVNRGDYFFDRDFGYFGRLWRQPKERRSWRRSKKRLTGLIGITVGPLDLQQTD
jgi:hypothetical protein